jgi:hypothetical protein
MNSLTVGAELVEMGSSLQDDCLRGVVLASLFGRNLTPSDGGLFS